MACLHYETSVLTAETKPIFRTVANKISRRATNIMEQVDVQMLGVFIRSDTVAWSSAYTISASYREMNKAQRCCCCFVCLHVYLFILMNAESQLRFCSQFAVPLLFFISCFDRCWVVDSLWVEIPPSPLHMARKIVDVFIFWKKFDWMDKSWIIIHCRPPPDTTTLLFFTLSLCCICVERYEPHIINYRFISDQSDVS